MLQARYGGSGVGWMPLSSETAGFRRTIRHEFKGWKEYKQLHKKGDYPLTGYYFTGQVGDWVRYTVAKGDRPFEIATIYYRATEPVSLSVSTNDGEARTIELPATEREGLEAYSPSGGTYQHPQVQPHLRGFGLHLLWGIARRCLRYCRR